MPVITIDIKEFTRKDGTIVSAHKRRINVDSLTSEESVIVDSFVDSLFNEPILADIPQEALPKPEEIIEEVLEEGVQIPLKRKGEGLVETGIIGAALIDSKKILIDAVNQQADTLPHEYAHHYIRMFKDTPIVQEGIKRFGSEEELVQKIGEQAVQQRGEAWGWWTRFKGFVLNFLSDNQVLGVLTDSFLERRDLSETDVTVDAIGYDDSLFDPSVVSEVLNSEPLSEIDPSTHEQIAQILQEKYPDIEVLYTEDGINPTDIEDPNVLFQLSNRMKRDFLARVQKKRPDLVEKGLVDSTIESINDYLDTLPDNLDTSKTSKAIVKWTLDSELILPEDGEKLTQVLEFSDKNSINMMQYNNPSEILELIEEEGNKELSPEMFTQFSNKRDIGNGVTLYDIEESREGQQATRDMIDSDWGHKFNNWCITYTENGQLTENSYELWVNSYGGTKTLAFKDGELASIKASGFWWDKLDNSHEAIPVSIRMNDGSGYRATGLISEDGQDEGLLLQSVDKVVKGNKKDGVFEEAFIRTVSIDIFGDKEELFVFLNRDGEVSHFEITSRGLEIRDKESSMYKDAIAELERLGGPYEIHKRTEHKDGKKHGLEEVFHVDGSLSKRIEYKDGEKHGKAQQWSQDGQTMFSIDYKDGKKHGTSEIYHDNGQLSSKKEYKDGNQHGLTEGWSEDGQLVLSLEYKDGLRNGTEKVWYKDGSRMSVQEWKNDTRIKSEKWHISGQKESENNWNEDGDRHGRELFWFSNGVKKLDINHKDGVLHGSVKSWIEDGTLIKSFEYKNGKKIGKAETWYKNGAKNSVSTYNDEGLQIGVSEKWHDNGNIAVRANWVDGKLFGKAETWHKNGQIQSVSTYNEFGRLDGVSEEWHDNGNKKYIANYKDGNQHGKRTRWSEGGNLRGEENYNDGRLDGEQKTWAENGALTSMRKYKDGEQEGVQEWWNEDGIKTSSQNYKDGTEDGKQMWWNEDGTPRKEFSFKSGKQHGVLKSWGDDGRLIQETHFRNGMQHGEDIRWTGDVKWLETYEDDVLNGPTKRWWGNGNLASSDNFKDGQRHGKLEEFNTDGTISRVQNYVDGFEVGEEIKYHRNGKIKYTRNYNSNSELDGEAKVYDEDGKLLRTLFFDNGVEIRRIEEDA